MSAQDDEVVRVNTDLVVLNVTVSDKEGRYVPGLKLADFKVFEEGREVPIKAHYELCGPRVSLRSSHPFRHFREHGKSLVARPLSRD